MIPTNLEELDSTALHRVREVPVPPLMTLDNTEEEDEECWSCEYNQRKGSDDNSLGIEKKTVGKELTLMEEDGGDKFRVEEKEWRRVEKAREGQSR